MLKIYVVNKNTRVLKIPFYKTVDTIVVHTIANMYSTIRLHYKLPATEMRCVENPNTDLVLADFSDNHQVTDRNLFTFVIEFKTYLNQANNTTKSCLANKV